MKKLLLTASAALMAMGAMAATDGATYPDASGLECKNMWITALNSNPDAFNAMEFSINAKARTAVQHNGIGYIGYSRTMEIGEEMIDCAHLISIDIATGKLLRITQLTCNGAPITGLLCCNQLGLDDYGHLWFTGLAGATKDTFPIYHIVDPMTGVCELAGEPQLPESEADALGRHDYYDLIGDVTGVQARTVFMTPVASGTNTYVLGWAREQGTDTWDPAMCEGEYVAQGMLETYPDGLVDWNGAPMIRIVRDEEHTGSQFYIDAFVTPPTLYSTSGEMIMSFADAPELKPKENCNGMMEFTIAGHNLIAYVVGDYDSSPGARIQICDMGENMVFEGMQKAWEMPTGGLGTISDGGTRSFGICPEIITDENGKEGTYLFLYKCRNGLAAYKIAEPGWLDPFAGVQEIETAVAEGPVKYFNLQGIEVAADNLTPGIYLRRQGNTTTKQLVK